MLLRPPDDELGRTSLDGRSVPMSRDRESQLLAQEQRYNAVKGEYDAYMQDHFRGKLIHPRGLPIPYPTLERKMAEVCS